MNAGRSIDHVRRLGRLVSSPGDAWLLTRMLGWSLVLPVLKRLLPLPSLVRLLHSEAGVRQRDPRREESVAALSEWVFRSRPRRSRDNCLDRALLTYRYLSRAAAEPTIVVGVAKGGGPEHSGFAGHAWVTVDGSPVHDDPERLEGFARLATFAADGRSISTEATIPSVEPREAQPRRSTPPPAAPPH
jgi:hypothetical protein